MQAGHADPGVELVRVVGDVVEVMFEPGFADELIDRAHGRRRVARQAFVGQQQQVARGVLAIEPILGGLEGEPYHAARIGQRLDARVHCGIGVEHDTGIRLSRVEVLDQAAQHCNALVVGDVPISVLRVDWRMP